MRDRKAPPLFSELAKRESERGQRFLHLRSTLLKRLKEAILALPEEERGQTLQKLQELLAETNRQVRILPSLVEIAEWEWDRAAR